MWYLPLWSSGQSSWLQIQRSRARFPALPDFLRSPLSLVSTIEGLLGRNSSGSSLENREYSRGDSLRWPRDTLYPQKLALTSPTCGGHSVGMVRLRTKTTLGCAIPEVVSRWLPTAAARVWSSGICGGQSGARAGFLRVLRPCHSFHQILHPHNHPGQVQ
jgi:hypothetical protein